MTPLLNNASNMYVNMTDEFLKSNYVPDMHQRSIYDIDYKSLKNKGIKLITFDIDETIAGDDDKDPPKAAITLMENLRQQGFTIALVTNNGADRGKHFGSILNLKYVSRAMKPLTKNFEKLLKEFHLKPSQMVHIGNSLLDDIAGGNSAGITTCLVKNVSGGIKRDEVPLVNELIRRGIWKP